MSSIPNRIGIVCILRSEKFRSEARVALGIVIVEVPVIEYVYMDRDNGHGNDEGKYDDSNPGKSKK